MKPWIEPAVGWGIVDQEDRLSPDVYDTKGEAEQAGWEWDKVIRVALVPLAVARKAGLLRRPK